MIFCFVLSRLVPSFFLIIIIPNLLLLFDYFVDCIQLCVSVARPQYRRSRREKARKYTHVGGRDGGAEGVQDVMEFRAAIRVSLIKNICDMFILSCSPLILIRCKLTLLIMPR